MRRRICLCAVMALFSIGSAAEAGLARGPGGRMYFSQWIWDHGLPGRQALMNVSSMSISTNWATGTRETAGLAPLTQGGYVPHILISNPQGYATIAAGRFDRTGTPSYAMNGYALQVGNGSLTVTTTYPGLAARPGANRGHFFMPVQEFTGVANTYFVQSDSSYQAGYKQYIAKDADADGNPLDDAADFTEISSGIAFGDRIGTSGHFLYGISGGLVYCFKNTAGVYTMTTFFTPSGGQSLEAHKGMVVDTVLYGGNTCPAVWVAMGKGWYSDMDYWLLIDTNDDGICDVSQRIGCPGSGSNVTPAGMLTLIKGMDGKRFILGLETGSHGNLFGWEIDAAGMCVTGSQQTILGGFYGSGISSMRFDANQPPAPKGTMIIVR